MEAPAGARRTGLQACGEYPQGGPPSTVTCGLDALTPRGCARGNLKAEVEGVEVVDGAGEKERVNGRESERGGDKYTKY